MAVSCEQAITLPPQPARPDVSVETSGPEMKDANATTQPAVSRLLRGSRAYPRLLRAINDPPALLYVRGELPDAHGIAVVGSRECTMYGRRIAYRLAVDIVRCGFVVVSGLARGIDAAAHRGALDGGGRTVAVLPTGIDRVYPPRHENLARRIARAGALVTEFEPGAQVFRGCFHQRNRIIAGLTAATVVVEAAHKSGAKITAKFALDYNREVMAVPGPVGSPTSDGANSLLAEGAAVCTGIDSLLRQLPDNVRAQATPRLRAARKLDVAAVEGLGDAAQAVLAAIPVHASCGVDELVAATSLPVGELLAALTDIEVRGLIRSVGSQRYERV